MYVSRIYREHNHKKYLTVLIQKSIRKGKKVIHQTLANITKWPEHVIEAIEFALKGGDVKKLQEINGFIEKQGKAYGALKVIVEIAKRLGIREVLGRGKTGILTMIVILVNKFPLNLRDKLA
ncbi:MAG: hypothetical protein AB1414_13645 [bacterium]